MSDIEDRVHAIECKVSELGVLTKRAMDAIQTLEDCQLVRLSPKQPEPALERYRMTRPTNIGAAVIDAGLFVWRLSSEARWRADEGMAWCQWADIADPQPYQNCTLTANDLEPPEGSLILDSQRLAHQRHDEYWYGPADSHADKMDVRRWSQLDFPVTLLYRGRK